jgi:predicted lipase
VGHIFGSQAQTLGEFVDDLIGQHGDISTAILSAHNTGRKTLYQVEEILESFGVPPQLL